MIWTATDVDNWYKSQKIQRSYQDDVVTQIESLRAPCEVSSYGALSQDPKRYPLFLIKTGDVKKPTVVITGGVHGYETSGVHGALAFMRDAARGYAQDFHFVCAPCISPWAYETINRWNAKAVDPNRSFRPDSPVEECRLFLNAVAGINPIAHFDLHETTDTDNSVFRPAKNARDGINQELTPIPDGFYLVGDSENPQAEFQKAMIDAVRKVTHIAPVDDQGRLIGEKIEQEGVINYPIKRLSLCASVFGAKYVTTTEVYPDSPKVNAQNCIDAQVTAIKAGLDFIR